MDCLCKGHEVEIDAIILRNNFQSSGKDVQILLPRNAGPRCIF